MLKPFCAGLMVLAISNMAFGQAPKDIFEAVRTDNLEAVKAFLKQGVSINSKDRYGLTPVAVSAQTGMLEIAEFLVSQKADLNIADSFYSVTPVLQALWNGHPKVAELLLKHGAEPRESALEYGAGRQNMAMVKAAIAGGPIHESTLTRLKSSSGSKEIKALLAKAKSRPDPQPPNYSEQELKRFEGNFEGFESDTTGVVSVKNGKLFASIDGKKAQELIPYQDLTFKAKDATWRLTFVGRAGTTEGFRLMRENSPPDLLRHSVAAPLEDAANAFRYQSKKVVSKTLVNWPGFRGPNGTGIADGADTSVEWNLETGDGVVWQSSLQGLGNSSPVIWGDTIFLTTAIAKGMKQELRVGNTGDASSVAESVEHRWLVYAFSKKTGKKLWEKEIGKAVPLTERHFKATQANSTPATDGTHVVVVFPTAGLACLDFDGNVKWHHELGGLNASAFYSPETQWGFAASPIIYKNTVILQVDVYGEPYIAAWDLKTGKQVWRTNRKVATSWSTPAIFPTKTGDELVVNGSVVFGYNPDNGKELWQLGPNSELVIAMPVIGEDVVYVSAGYPPIKPIYAIKAGIRGKHTLDPGKPAPNIAWSHKRGGSYMPTPLLYHGLFYIVHHNGRLVVYDAKSGEAIHKARFSQRGTFTASPIAVNNKIYMPTEEGLLYVLDAKPPFKELAVHDFDEPLMATPAVSEGCLFVRTPSKLYAIGNAK